MRTRLAFFIASAALASGCGGLQVDYGEPVVLKDRAEPPVKRESAAKREPAKKGDAAAEEAAAVAAAMRLEARARLDYKISPTDLISVTVYEVAEMNRKVRVNASGVVFLPLVGAVEVGGKSLGAAQSLIEKKLASYVVKPQVTLFIEEYGNRRISMMGEVQRPGSYPIPSESRMTILEAISTAGGFTPVAAPDRARVLRYVNGESVKYTIDVRTLTRGDSDGRDMVLEPNDVVFIPQSLF